MSCDLHVERHPRPSYDCQGLQFYSKIPQRLQFAAKAGCTLDLRCIFHIFQTFLQTQAKCRRAAQTTKKQRITLLFVFALNPHLWLSEESDLPGVSGSPERIAA